MTRLRLAPSSPERMAGQIRTLIMRQGYSSAYWTQSSEWVSSWNRGARLLLRWYAHGIARIVGAEDEYAWGIAGHSDKAYRYHQEWCTQYPYQLWPQDGDERLRRELDE